MKGRKLHFAPVLINFRGLFSEVLGNPPTTGPKSIQEVGELYQSCMNEGMYLY